MFENTNIFDVLLLVYVYLSLDDRKKEFYELWDTIQGCQSREEILGYISNVINK